MEGRVPVDGAWSVGRVFEFVSGQSVEEGFANWGYIVLHKDFWESGGGE